MIDATRAIIADERMIADSDRWFRTSRAEIDEHSDGPTLEAAGLSFLALTYARLFPVSAKTSHDAWLSQTRDTQVGSAPVLGLIAVRDRYDRAQTIAAGRCWQRLHLDATLNGVALQPVNQPIEMIDRERQLGASRRIRATHHGADRRRLAGDVQLSSGQVLALRRLQSPTPACRRSSRLTACTWKGGCA